MVAIAKALKRVGQEYRARLTPVPLDRTAGPAGPRRCVAQAQVAHAVDDAGAACRVARGDPCA